MPAVLGEPGRILIADGGWTTELRQRGFPVLVPSEQAVLERPDLIEATARDYLAAGANILSTHTFSANAIAAPLRKLDVDVAALNQQAAEQLRALASPSSAMVAGVLGPCGRIVSVGEISEEELFEAYTAQATALGNGGVDLLVLETFSDIREAQAVVRAAKSAGDVPVVACMSFDSGPQRTQTIMGTSADEAAKLLGEAGADAIGLNCSGGWLHALPAVVALRSHTDLPLWIAPSGGVPDLVEGLPQYRSKPEDYDEVFQQVLSAGPQVVGGCCGIGPAHIRRFAAMVEAHQRRPGDG